MQALCGSNEVPNRGPVLAGLDGLNLTTRGDGHPSAGRHHHAPALLQGLHSLRPKALHTAAVPANSAEIVALGD